MENLFEALSELQSLNEAPANSNGIYSLTKGWLKEPVRDKIPDNIDLEPELTEWKEKANKCKTIEDIDDYIDNLYKLRQEGLLKDGEYSKENLIFKEIRNLGILQTLKDQKTELENKEMSLEENMTITEGATGNGYLFKFNDPRLTLEVYLQWEGIYGYDDDIVSASEDGDYDEFSDYLENEGIIGYTDTLWEILDGGEAFCKDMDEEDFISICNRLHINPEDNLIKNEDTITKKGKKLSEDTLLEYQQKDLKQKFGKELAQKFLDNRQRYPAPYNSLDYWMKQDEKVFQDYMDNFESKTSIEKKQRVEGADKIYEDNNCIVLHIKTYEAAVQYGKGSKWCICGNYPGYENRGKQLFDDYLKRSFDGYYLYIKKNPIDPTKDGKYMICVNKGGEKNTIYNQADYTIEYIPGAIDIPGLPPISQFKIKDGRLHKVQINKYSSEVEINIPLGVTSLAPNVFLGKKEVKKVIISPTVESIGSGCFAFSGIESFYSNRVVELGEGVLEDCHNLKQVRLGAPCTTLGDYCFASSPNLEYINILGSITSIGRDVFTDDYSGGLKVKCDPDKNKLLIDYLKKVTGLNSKQNITIYNQNGEVVYDYQSQKGE